MKQLPTLPDNIAKDYECLIVPTKVILQNPRRVIDLTRIKPSQAEELANEGRFLKRKDEKAEPVKSAAPENTTDKQAPGKSEKKKNK